MNKFLMSAPDGQVIEFLISDALAKKLPELLANGELWKLFFSSLINSWEMQNV